MPKGVYDHNGQGKRGGSLERVFIKKRPEPTAVNRAVVEQTKMAEEALAEGLCPECKVLLQERACPKCSFRFLVISYSGPDTRNVRPEFYRRVEG